MSDESSKPEVVNTNSPLALNWRVVLEVALGILVGLGVAAAGLVVILPLAQRQFGFFAYQGLSVAQVQAVAKEMDARMKTLTRTSGSHRKGHRFFRGVYLSEAGVPIYYKYTYEDGSASFEIYPMLYEKFTTDPDISKSTGKMLYPPAGMADHHRRYRG